MKVFKAVIVLTVAMISLSSTVAFGCDAGKISDQSLNSSKNDDQASNDSSKAADPKAGALEHKDK